LTVLRSSGQENLTYVLLSDAELSRLDELLRKPRKKVSPEARALGQRLREGLKQVRR
jgi:hypothetical protein